MQRRKMLRSRAYIYWINGMAFYFSNISIIIINSVYTFTKKIKKKKENSYWYKPSKMEFLLQCPIDIFSDCLSAIRYKYLSFFTCKKRLKKKKEEILALCLINKKWNVTLLILTQWVYQSIGCLSFCREV